jgi:hypothetical protein
MNADGTNPARLMAGGDDADWQPVTTNYPRPKGASPAEIYLVPAYASCAAPNRTHGSPLAFPSCAPPLQTSGQLTVGTPDANGQAPKSIASVIYKAKTTSFEDLLIKIAISDVRNRSDLSDYTGELQLNTPVRITDRDNGPSLSEPGTIVDFLFPITFSCSATADTTVGAACNVQTSINAVVPGSISDGKRAVWQLGQASVDDGGPDGDAQTPADNSVFMRQGIFVP